MAGMEGVYIDMVSAPSAVIAATSGVMAEGLIFDMTDVIGADARFAKLRRRFPMPVFPDPARDLSAGPVFTMDASLNRSARPGEKVIPNAAR